MGGPGMGRGPGMRGPGMLPPPPPRWGYRGYRRSGCLGCLLPVLLMGARWPRGSRRCCCFDRTDFWRVMI